MAGDDAVSNRTGGRKHCRVLQKINVLKKILSKARNVLRTDFVIVSSWSAVSTLIKMITSFVSIKVVSGIIGPSGIAMVGQFMNTITIVNGFATGSISQGVTKYIAEHYDDPVQQKKVISNASFITLICTAVTSVVVILFSSSIGEMVFKTSDYNELVLLFGASLFLYTLNTLIVSILNGFKSFRKFILVNIITSIAALAVSVLLVLFWGVYGALLNCIISQSVIIFITFFFTFKEPWFRAIFSKLSFDKAITVKLLKFSLMLLTTSVLTPYSQILVRDYISTNISIDTAGLWEGMNRLSAMYLMFITTSISIYYLPRLSEIREPGLLQQEIIKTGKIVLPFLAATCIAIYLFRYLVIRVVFSDQFLPMQQLFAAQMVGDFFKIASWMIAYLFWAKAMTRLYIMTEVIFSASFVFLSIYGVKNYGLMGSSMGYAANYILYFLVMLLLFRNIIRKK